jgi:hypothetical protein
MTVKQLAEIFKAEDCARMLRGEEQPRQEAFVNGYGDVDWGRAHARRALQSRLGALIQVFVPFQGQIRTG